MRCSRGGTPCTPCQSLPQGVGRGGGRAVTWRRAHEQHAAVVWAQSLRGLRGWARGAGRVQPGARRTDRSRLGAAVAWRVEAGGDEPEGAVGDAAAVVHIHFAPARRRSRREGWLWQAQRNRVA